MKKTLIRVFIPFFLTLSLLAIYLSNNISRKNVESQSVDSNFATYYNAWKGDLKVFSNTGNYKVIDKNIYLTDKLVYKNNEEIKIYAFSNNKTYFDIENPYDKKVITTGSIKPSKSIEKKDEGTNFDLNDGFNLDEFNFKSINLPENLNGWYSVNISQTKGGSLWQQIPIFIDSGKKESEILFVEGTDTFRAYNFVGNMWNYYNQPFMLGGVFFRPKSYPANYKIFSPNDSSFNNSDSCKDHLINADSVLQNSIKKWGYKFDSKPDEFLDKYSNIANYKTIIFGSHNEYWTLNKINNIIKFIDNGGKVVYLGGNTAWRNVERSNNGNYIWGSGLLKEKWVSAKEDIDYFSKLEVLNKFLVEYLGSYYDSRGLNTSAPFEDNNGIEFGTNNLLSTCTNTKLGNGASGHETDKLVKDSKGFNVLARGKNEDGGAAQIVYKNFPSGGKVLNIGSVNAWMYIEDPNIRKMVENIL